MGLSRMKKPIISKSEISDTYYLLTDYIDKGNGHFIAKRKFDITTQMEFWMKEYIKSKELCCKCIGRKGVE
jgi:hypothetical protein